MMWLVILFIIGLIILVTFLLSLMFEKRKQIKTLDGRHVVVTGGSSGIGLSAAKESAKIGADVTIIGRDVAKLNAAVEEIKTFTVNKTQKIQLYSLDVTASYEEISKAFKHLEESIGPIFMLINSAGSSVCGKFEDMSEDDIRNLINLNYFGTALPTKYVLSGMKSRGEGRIVFVSSEAALIGIYGLSAYSGAKWAVRGLAESVAMELVGTGVHLTLAFPPDTDTPGYHAENASKPEETKLICNTSGLVSPDEVGKQILLDALAGKTYSVVAFGGKLMSVLFCGLVESPWQVLVQIFTMGLLRIVFVGILLSFHSIIKDQMKKRNDSKVK